MKAVVRFPRKDILNGKISQQMLLFLFPVFLGYLVQQLYGIVDSIVLGRLISKQALAAVGGSANSLINIILNFIGGITSAITVLVAQNYGRGNMEKVNQSAKTGVFLSIVLGLGISIALILIAPFWLDLMKEPADTRPLSLTYLYFYLASLSFYFVYQTGVCILRALGDSRRPLLFIGLTAVVKISLDLLFAGVFRLGVFGTSLATFLSHAICAFIILFIFDKTSDVYQRDFKDLSYNKEDVKKIFAIGLPFAVQSMMFAIPNAMIQFKINSFETDAVAAYSAYNSVDALFWCFSNALTTATITMASQNFGRGNLKRVRRTVLVSVFIDTVGAVCFGALFYFFGKHILTLFLKDPEPLSIATRMLKVIAFSYITYAPIDPLSAVFKSCGLTRAPLIIAVFTICLTRISYILFYPIADPVQAIFAFPLSWIITSAVYAVYYFSRKDIFRKNENNA
ncbi:MAG: MATE family efflux transporter [Erysipelotrichaceae bacterium]|nr:MATE family efflux transporter [Erysipelotrichaceae bacterium]